MPLVPLTCLALLLPAAAAAGEAGDPPAVRVEVALRAVASTGRTTLTLRGFSGAATVSRLDYRGLDGLGAELSVRLSHRSGAFAAADLGVDRRDAGTLVDEDFEPFVTPASSTDSALGGGRARLLILAAGYDAWTTPRARLAPFVGWLRAEETLHAHGCVQTGANPDICRPAIPDPVRVISLDATWRSLVAGLDGAVTLDPAVTLSGRLAVLPWLSLDAADTHWLRTGPDPDTADFRSPTPIDGRGGLGWLGEAALGWRGGSGLRLGAGVRLLRLEISEGTMHFERSVHPRPGSTPAPQPVSLRGWRAALRLEAGWAF